MCFVLVLSIFGGLGFAGHDVSEPTFTLDTEITIGRMTIDTALGEPAMPDEYKIDSYSTETGVYLVQFNQYTEPWMLEFLENLGITDYQHINRNTYRIEMPVAIEGEVRELSYVQWLGIYQPYYKMDDEVWGSTGQITIEIELTKTGDVEHITHVVKSYGGVVENVIDDLVKIVRVTIDANVLPIISAEPTVTWMFMYHPPQTHMNLIRQSAYTGAVTAYTGGFTGSGMLGQVKDNGCDMNHPELDNVLYTQGSVSSEAHGTCTSGIVFAQGDTPNARGMMPEAEGCFSDWNEGRTVSINALEAGFFGSDPGQFESNSWSSGTLNGLYTSYTYQDDTAIDNNPHIIMLYAMGNGNDGTDWGDMTQDAALKNGLGIGAIWHHDTADMSDDEWHASGWGNTPSRGFSADSRLKPDLCGAFDWIYTIDEDPGGYVSGAYYDNFGGTSGATPMVAGQVGLAYEMFMENYFGNNPGGSRPYASTVKALMIADAYQYPNFLSDADRHEQGWGSADIENVYNLGASGHYMRDCQESVSAGGLETYYVTPNGGGTPLKISLAWTDPPAASSTGSGRALINNLDLTVIAPDNTHYYGNNGLDNDLWSDSGTGTNYWDNGLPAYMDGYNNVENVFIESPMAGMWTIEVSGRTGDVPQGPQAFSLVASGAQEYVPGNPPTVTLTDPNGGENWEVGSFHDITWTMSDTEDPSTALEVTLDYSTNGVTYPYNIITDQTGFGSSGVYPNWQIPNTPSGTCRVRITVRDTASSTDSDESNGVFTIYSDAPAVNAVSPDVGDSLPGGGAWEITWTASAGSFPLVANPISIYYSASATGPWTPIASNEPNDGTYDWNPVPTFNGNYYIRITADDTGGHTGEDINGPFEIDSSTPAPPSNPRAEISGLNVMIYWDPSPSSDIDHYEVYYNLNTWDPTGASYASFLDSGGPGTSVQHTGVGSNNANSYFYQVKAVDEVGHLSSGTTRQAAKLGSTQSTFANPTGWFLMGSSLVQSDTSIAHVIQGQGLPASMDCLRSYETPTDYWPINIPTAPSSINTLTDITDEMGFWMHVSGNTRFVTAGYIEDKTITLNAGWNMVAYPFAERTMTTASIATHLSSNCPNYAEMLIADHTQPYQLVTPVGTESIAHNYGIWIRVTADTTWTVTNY